MSRGREARAFRLVCCLAAFNQATASTAIMNYAPTLLQRLQPAGGLSDAGAVLFTAVIALTKVVGVGIGAARCWCGSAQIVATLPL